MVKRKGLSDEALVAMVTNGKVREIGLPRTAF
jgi:hypothetical protein